MIEGPEEVPAKQGRPAEHGHCAEVERVADGQAESEVDGKEVLVQFVDGGNFGVVFGDGHVVRDEEEEGGHEDGEDVSRDDASLIIGMNVEHL